MLRDQWKFRYTADQLAKAVRDKIQYHEERYSFWNHRKQGIIDEIKSHGIEVNEKSVLLQGGSPKMRDYQQGGEILIRNDLRKGLSETYEKLAYHTGRKDIYDGWNQVLTANAGNALDLDIADWLFFFGRDTGTGED